MHSVAAFAGGSDLWRAHKLESRRGLLWGLGSHSATSTPPALLHPGCNAPLKGLMLAMVYAGPSFSCRNRGRALICGGRVIPIQDEGFLWGWVAALHIHAPRAAAPRLNCAV